MNIWILSTAYVALILLMISQHWFMWCLNAISQQAITLTNADPDLWCHQTTVTNKSFSQTQFITKAFNLVDVFESKNKLEFVNP